MSDTPTTTNAPRFSFPGFVPTKTRDTEKYEVEIGTIMVGGKTFVLDMLRSKKVTFLPFMVMKVSDEKGELWNLHFANITGVTHLADANGTPVIAVVAKGKGGKLLDIIPLSVIGGEDRPGLRHQIALKAAAAHFLGLEYELSDTEKKLKGIDCKRQRDAEVAQEQAERDERARKRAEFIATVEKRPQITCFTADGQKRFGYPVTEEEWPRMPHNTHCIRVEGFDESGTPGKLIEAFKVQKLTGNPQKGFAVAVYPQMKAPLQSAGASKPAAVKPRRTIFVETKDDVREVQLYNSMDEIRTARAAGLNSGALAAVDKKLPTGKYEVYAVRKESLEVLGHYPELS